MANQEGTRDTSGVTGNPGRISDGTQYKANVRDTSVDGDAPQFSGPFADPTSADHFETSSGSGYELPHLADHSNVDANAAPADTNYRGTLETLDAGAHHVKRQYQAPAMFTPGTNVDTSWTDVLGVGYHRDREVPLQYHYLTPDAPSIAAGAPGELGEEDVTLDADNPVDLSQRSIFQGTLVVRTNGGHTENREESLLLSEEGTELQGRGVLPGTVSVSAVVDSGESVTLTDDEEPVELSNHGIVSSLDDIVVEHNGTTLTAGDDYVLSESIQAPWDPDGGGASYRLVSIAWVSGGALPDGTESVDLSFRAKDELTEDTDYTVDVLGADASAFVVVTLDSGSSLVGEGDEASVSYEVGGFGYFKSERLVEGIDYVSERTTGAGGVTTSLRVSDSPESRVGDGDDVTVTYLHGSTGTYNSRLPSAPPNAVTDVYAFARDRGVEVQWNHPVGGERYDGFLIEVSNEHSFQVSENDGVEGASLVDKTMTANGTLVTSGNSHHALVGSLEPDRHLNEHDSGHEGVFGTYKDYRFRVAAINHNGTGEFSDWTSPSTAPVNFDEVPPSSIPRKNRVNPIYRADGSVVPGTGTGSN